MSRSWIALAAGWSLATWPAAAMAGPPQALFGKSVVAAWTESRDIKFTDGTIQHVTIRGDYAVYVSSQGRVFSQLVRKGINKQGQESGVASGASRGPDGNIKTRHSRGNRVLKFEGRSLITNSTYESGARHITIAFDEGFRNCTVGVIFGKEAGAPGIVNHGMTGRLFMLVSVDVGATSCAIRDGAAVGGE